MVIRVQQWHASISTLFLEVTFNVLGALKLGIANPHLLIYDEEH